MRSHLPGRTAGDVRSLQFAAFDCGRFYRYPETISRLIPLNAAPCLADPGYRYLLITPCTKSGWPCVGAVPLLFGPGVLQDSRHCALPPSRCGRPRNWIDWLDHSFLFYEPDRTESSFISVPPLAIDCSGGSPTILAALGRLLPLGCPLPGAGSSGIFPSDGDGKAAHA
jgi:hypothetical protein